MVEITYDNVTKRYGDEIGARDVSITIADGEFAVLLGPSGCGKTTLLRCLAGLTDPTSGQIRLDGEDITGIHPKDRDIAMVFQELALYPHMDTTENIGYPLKVEGVDESRRQARVEEVAEMLEIGDLLGRETDELSGGQRQRVAIGRAIVRRPSVFLMDEPLSSLDAKLKVEMRNEIKKLQRDLGITTLYVTHDQEEAMTLGDKLIVMNDGEIKQVGTPYDVYHDPANQFVAGFIGSPGMNFLRMRRDGRQSEYLASVDSGSDVAFRYADIPDGIGSGEAVVLGVRPQYFTVHQSPADGTTEVRITVTEPMGDEQLLTAEPVGADTGELSVRVPIDVGVTRGESVWLGIETDGAYFFEPATGKRVRSSSRSKIPQSSREERGGRER